MLLAPLGTIHRLSCGLLGYKIIPDGGWSTLFVSAYFFAVGPLIAASLQRLERTSPSLNACVRPCRLAGLVYLGVGAVSGLLAIGLISSVDGMDDYYYVPHTCECLECLHGTKTAPDGRVHCAKYPPGDIKMSEVSADYVTFCQSVVGFGGVSGLGFSALTTVFGVQRLFTRTQRAPRSRWQLRVEQAAPFAAVLFPAIAVPFLWPFGIVPR